MVPGFGVLAWAPWLGPPRLKKGKSNFCTIRNFIHAIKSESLNIMHLHTARTMDGPWIKTVPVVSRIFGVSSSMGLEIEGCRTCWKYELGNHTLELKLKICTNSRRQNLIFFINCNILHTLKKEPLNIMLLHTSRRMDGA